MTEDDKMRIRAARYQWAITDPYPEIALWEMKYDISGLFDRTFTLEPKPEISAHKAWMDGFKFAWELVEKKLREIPTEVPSPTLLSELRKKVSKESE